MRWRLGSRDGQGTIGILAWNATLDHSRAGGDPDLRRQLHIPVTGLPGKEYQLSQWRVDADHGNVTATWQRMGGGDWPDSRQWQELATADQLPPVEQPRLMKPHRGTVEIVLELPMPSIAYLELRPH